MAKTKYIWDPISDNVLMEKDDNGDTQASYTYLPESHGDLISQHRSGETSFYHFDGQRSTRALTDGSENVIDTYTYSAFGENVSITGTTTNPYRYVGEKGYYFDEETEDYYVRRRTYGPAIGRWMSPDPTTFLDGVNFYRYASNDPLSTLDSSGLIGVETHRFFTNRCGKFRWDVDWTVTDVTESGFIIQFMDVSIACCDCNRKKNECGCFDCKWDFVSQKLAGCRLQEKHYTEVWFVRHDPKTKGNRVYDQFCKGPSGDHHRPRARDHWCFNGCEPDRYNRDTCGQATWLGHAFFVPEKDFPSANYGFGGEPFSGCLLSSGGQDKKLLAKAKGARVDNRILSTTWSCCGPESLKRDEQRGLYAACCWTELWAFTGTSTKTENRPASGPYRDFHCVSMGDSYGCPQDFIPEEDCAKCLNRPIALPP